MISGPFKRILIIEVNWVGDVLFSTPFIRSMRNRFPAAHIACAVVPGTKEVLEYNPKINELIIYDEKGRDRGLWGKLRFVSLLKKKKFDLAVLLHRSATRAFMAYLGGARERVGYRTGKNKVFLTEWVEISDEHLHKVDYFLKIAELFRGKELYK